MVVGLAGERTAASQGFFDAEMKRENGDVWRTCLVPRLLRPSLINSCFQGVGTKERGHTSLSGPKPLSPPIGTCPWVRVYVSCLCWAASPSPWQQNRSSLSPRHRVLHCPSTAQPVEGTRRCRAPA